jgi:predicted acyltransferase (DUF342 family)
MPSHTLRTLPATVKPTLAAITVAALLAACGGGGAPSNPAAAPASVGRVAGFTVDVGALVPAATGLSGNVTCDNLAIGAARLDTVIVPPGAACLLEGTALIGSILVSRDATLVARAVRLNGNVQAEGAAFVGVEAGSSVGGSVQIEQGAAASVSGARITGDLQVDAQSGVVDLRGNAIGGSLQAVGNRGGLLIQDNTMRGNLQCKENAPAPVVGGNAAASIEDQCAPGGASQPVGSGAPTLPVGGLSGNVTCAGLAIGAVSLDTVIVPEGATCTLTGTRLIGSIEVKAGAWLVAEGVSVNGNLVADGAAQVRVDGGSSFGGSVQVKQGGSASVSHTRITGDLQFDAMAGPLAAAGNRIGGNLQAFGNQGGLTVSANAIDGALQCKDNRPAPVGSGNAAAQKQDQCARL